MSKRGKKGKKQKKDNNLSEGSSEEGESNFENTKNKLLSTLNSESKNERESGYLEFSKHITNYIVPAFFSDLGGFLDSVKYSLKNGSQNEIQLCLSCLYLASFTIPEDSLTLYHDVQKTLEKLIQIHESGEVRQMAIRSIGVLCFVIYYTQDSTEVAEKALQKLFGILQEDNLPTGENYYGYIAEFLQMCGLLLSIMPHTILSKELETDPELPGEYLFDYAVSLFRNLMGHKSPDVRQCAATNIAMLYNMKDIYDEEEDEELVCETILDDVLVEMSQLEGEHSKKVSRKVKTQQRSVFRELIKSIEEQDYPEIEHNVSGNTIDVVQWQKVLQFNVLKNCLQTGFQKHLEKNQLFSTVFDYVIKNKGFREKKSYKNQRKQFNKKKKNEREKKIFKERKKKYNRKDY
ncbi:hypothetical protein M0813_12652 [Anaeramoeba flamelloides]|uniref:Interferon-related developmental regulator N-terminal domain-containing protein n=1 Tax=Anaeramoeba flamelloides TaxID=1746091 RepID=A0ABQ8ZB67_9EUKA|nr:hypothetical protein M0813_12652 [Anaeramoeba flamelloides]